MVLQENVIEDINSIFSKFEKTTKAIYNTAKTLGVENTKFLLTYSAMIGALARPLNATLNLEFPSLTGPEITLLIIGICSILYNQNASEIRQITRLIRERNLIKEFNFAKRKIDKLIDLLRLFVTNSVKSVKMANEIIFFTFLLPMLDYLLKIGDNNLTSEDFTELAKRVVALSVVAINQYTIKKLLQKVTKEKK
jgi:hypothetical protein